MPKVPTAPAIKVEDGVLHAPYIKAPLMLIHTPTERKILVPRLENYECMIKLVEEKIYTPQDSSTARLVLKSSTVPGLEGEKVEISKEVWPELVGLLKTFEVNELKHVRSARTKNDTAAVGVIQTRNAAARPSTSPVTSKSQPRAKAREPPVTATTSRWKPLPEIDFHTLQPVIPRQAPVPKPAVPEHMREVDLTGTTRMDIAINRFLTDHANLYTGNDSDSD